MSQKSKQACVDAKARLGENVRIAPFVIISAGAVIGNDVSIEAGTIIYENVVIGDNTHIGAHCVLGERLGGRRVDENYVNPKLDIGPDSIIRSGTIWDKNSLPSAVRDDNGNFNRYLDPHRTGWHLWQFTE